jgi:hypothetical protein
VVDVSFVLGVGEVAVQQGRDEEDLDFWWEKGGKES